ncbi:HpcH/HpaI aldolase/citrate lyase family protein [Psychrobacter sp. I-STPA6b]|uniref:HpcH/HpaI aldolase/citrate lyase family protein n=1 Tax=Psychrobacter sp. I-STPA6b TaxID=2585718 RepID=UPI001D0CD1D3|nr:HpcH/HpaI aldolase/citrate lyase family protein [Psychrobacter sp. I-STPA6b]
MTASAHTKPQSQKHLHPYHLGASLYMPATRQDIWQVICREKLPTLNSVIICFEDAVNSADVDMALQQLQTLLTTWATHSTNLSERPLVFIRPRHPQMLQQLADFTDIELIDGFVLPKIDMNSLSQWRIACQYISDKQLLMPTLETAPLFQPLHNQDLAIALKEAFTQPIFALRIGGNDLFSVLRLRRPHQHHIYDTPIGTLIYQLLGCFVPHGFYLTAPVFEYLEQPTLFMQELSTDVSLGLVGKTVIHPNQIALVQQAYAVPNHVLDEAQAILHSDAKAVFKYNNSMLEPATHRIWATQIIERAEVFGTC